MYSGGTVTVNELMVVEHYSYVMHIACKVFGKLTPHKTVWDLLKACFPAGIVSRTPTIRTMETIHKLEPCRCGLYSGVYVYYDFEGQLNSAIAIITMVANNNTLSVQVRTRLVVDSEPEKKYEEALNKAKGLLEAIRCLY